MDRVGARDEPGGALAVGCVGPGSMAWRINGEVVGLLGWGRAILLQLAHPLVAAGVADHSRFAREPRGRLRRLRHTLDAMLTLTYGSPAEVAAVAQHINATHDRVHGVLREAVGPFPAGTPYTAHDPHLLRWVHATFVDSALRVYQLYVRPLSRAEQDQYCAEAATSGPLLGMPPGYLPASAAALEAYLAAMLASGEIVVGETARALARALLAPLSPPLRPLEAFLYLPMVGLLPPAIREGYGLPWTPRHERALAVSAAVVRRLLPLLPSALRRWPAARAAEARGRRGWRAPGLPGQRWPPGGSLFGARLDRAVERQ
ncbi:MAG TPA: oxygenase MpaB family protein [Chloroflexota bacterium]|nr:oxygenase MpaB family protein [Chloroflexota bacterium]